jgi:nitrous oxidase accessory protein NosD
MMIVDQSGKGDFSTIRAAIAAASVDPIIMIRPGRYVEHLEIHQSLSLIGDTPAPTLADVDANWVEIVGSVTIDAPEVTLRDLSITMSVTDAKLEEALRLLFDAPDTMSAARLISGNVDVSQRDDLPSTVTFFEQSDHQVAAVLALSGQVQMERCTIVGGCSTGIALCNPQVHLTARHCDIYEGYLGLYLAPYTAAALEDCVVHRTTRLGICADRPHQLSLRQCQVRHNLGTGIYLMNCETVTIAHCQIHDNRESGLLARHVQNLVMQDCQIFNHGNNGVCLRHQSRGTMRDCEFYGNVWPSVAVIDAVDLTVQSSHFHEGMTEGIKVSHNCRVDVQHCTIEQHLLAGLYVERDSTLTIRDSEIQDHPAQAVIIQTHSNVLLERSRLRRNGDGEKVAAIRNHGNLRLRYCRINWNYLGLDCDADSASIVNFSNLGFNQTGAIRNQGGSKISKFLSYESLAKTFHTDHRVWKYAPYGVGLLFGWYLLGQVWRSPSPTPSSAAAPIEQSEPDVSFSPAVTKGLFVDPIASPTSSASPIATISPTPDKAVVVPSSSPSPAAAPSPEPSPEPASERPTSPPIRESAPSRSTATNYVRPESLRRVAAPIVQPVVQPVVQPITPPTPKLIAEPIPVTPPVATSPTPDARSSTPDPTPAIRVPAASPGPASPDPEPPSVN